MNKAGSSHHVAFNCESVREVHLATLWTSQQSNVLERHALDVAARLTGRCEMQLGRLCVTDKHGAIGAMPSASAFDCATTALFLPMLY